MEKILSGILTHVRNFLATVLFFVSPAIVFLLTENAYMTFAVLALFAVALFQCMNQVLEEHYQKLTQNRTNDSICSFARSFDFRNVDTKIIRAVYEELQDYLPNSPHPFPIRAQDNLFDDLRLDEDDLDLDIVEAVARRTGRSLDNYEDNPHYRKATTVGGLVMFFDAQPRIKAL